jgi:hypothetical protein
MGYVSRSHHIRKVLFLFHSTTLTLQDLPAFKDCQRRTTTTKKTQEVEYKEEDTKQVCGIERKVLFLTEGKELRGILVRKVDFQSDFGWGGISKCRHTGSEGSVPNERNRKSEGSGDREL